MNARQAFKQGFWIGAKGGLLEEKHRRAMGDSVWLFMYLLRGQTAVSEFGEGVFEYGHPITIRKISEDFGGTSERTIHRWIARLRKAGYIETEFHSEKGLTFWIAKAKQKTKSAKVTKSARCQQKVSTECSQVLTNVDASNVLADCTPYTNRVGSGIDSLHEPRRKSGHSLHEPRIEYFPERPQPIDSETTCGASEFPTPKSLTPKNPFYYNTTAAAKSAAVSLSSLLKETSKKLQPQENPVPVSERQRQLREQAEIIQRRYPDSGKKAWKEIRAMGYGPKEATA